MWDPMPPTQQGPGDPEVFLGPRHQQWVVSILFSHGSLHLGQDYHCTWLNEPRAGDSYQTSWDGELCWRQLMSPQAHIASMPILPLFLPDDPLLFLSFLIQIRQLTLQACLSTQHWPHGKFMWKALILVERRGSKELLGRKTVGRPDGWP